MSATTSARFGLAIYVAACIAAVLCLVYGAFALRVIYDGETSDPKMYVIIALKAFAAAVAIFIVGRVIRQRLSTL